VVIFSFFLIDKYALFCY